MSKDIKSQINRCKPLIIENIIIDNNFLTKSKQFDLFPESVINNIQNQNSRLSKIECMLEALTIHDNKWESFCNTLELSGQKFLTYVIRQENNVITDECKNIVDMGLSKFTDIDLHLSSADINKLTNYISEKMKSKLLYEIYNGCIQEKDKTMKAKEIHMYDIMKYIETVQDNKHRMSSISAVSEELHEKLINTDNELKSKTQELEQIRRDSVIKLKVKQRFHKSNEKQLFRLQRRLSNINNYFVMLNSKIEVYVDKENVSSYCMSVSKDSEINFDKNQSSISDDILDDISEESDYTITNSLISINLKHNVELLIDRVLTLEKQVDTLNFYRIQYDDLYRHLSSAISSQAIKRNNFEKTFNNLNINKNVQVKPITKIFKQNEINSDLLLKNLNEKLLKYQNVYVNSSIESYESTIQIQNEKIQQLKKKIQELEISIINAQKIIDDENKISTKTIKNLNFENSRLRKYAVNSRNKSEVINDKNPVSNSIENKDKHHSVDVQDITKTITKLDFNFDK
ncbi:hypothetical protein A3Q56_03040 [Intoshia linei]|uniref:Uncharacterized protein n=1 Tax=Intoshia linei TaxID=1819745 RepID=A0A177B4L1_9BILA|nr:hypothetical protein A3Q56_03040 [Intoshia linei]